MSQPTFHVDPDYQQAAAPFIAIPPPPTPHTLDSLRDINNTAIVLTMAVFRCPEADHVIETTLEYTSQDGTRLTLHRFTPTTTTAPYTTTTAAAASASSSTLSRSALTPLRPAVLYLHGGGFISGSVPLFRKDIARYAQATNTTFFAPEYRLAPEYPYPKPLEDVYAALEYLRTHGPELGVDCARLCVMGISAGGALAVGAALMARDRGMEPGIKKLVLVGPMLDDRTTMKAGDVLERVLTWTGGCNEMAWAAYLAWVRETESEVPAYAAPARAEDFRGLPRTYIDAGSLDLFWGECRQFAVNLWGVGDDVVESHWYPGVPHAWEWIAPSAPVTRKAIENRVRALRDL